MNKICLVAALLFINGFVFAETRVLFSPNGNIGKEIITDINHCSKTLDIMVFSLTSESITKSILDAAARGVKIRIIADSFQNKDKPTKIEYLNSHGIKIKMMKGREQGIMHNKVAIFDGVAIFTGSYNWTENSEHYNHENALFTDDPQAVKPYIHQFEKLWSSDEN